MKMKGITELCRCLAVKYCEIVLYSVREWSLDVEQHLNAFLSPVQSNAFNAKDPCTLLIMKYSSKRNTPKIKNTHPLFFYNNLVYIAFIYQFNMKSDKTYRSSASSFLMSKTTCFTILLVSICKRCIAYTCHCVLRIL